VRILILKTETENKTLPPEADNRFLHFLCKPCGERCRPLRDFSFPLSIAAQNSPFSPQYAAGKIFLTCVQSARTAGCEFPQLHQNAELTARVFARTFFFAHSIKIHPESARDSHRLIEGNFS
jgi:hypothetical protein